MTFLREPWSGMSTCGHVLQIALHGEESFLRLEQE